MAAPRFDLGRVVGTPAALRHIMDNGQIAGELLARHQRGDWGEVDAQDRKENERSVREGLRILSSYSVGGERVWIITEADRSSTCILLPEEY